MGSRSPRRSVSKWLSRPCTIYAPGEWNHGGRMSTTDDELHRHINRLVDEERQLRNESAHSDEQRTRLRELENSLDQCWDLLRQRAALRDTGGDPDAATARPVPEVEGYLQ